MQYLLVRRALAVLLLLLLPLPAFALPRERDVWLRAESDHFVFFSGASERSTRRIAVNLERLRDVLVQLNPGMEVGSGPSLYVYIFEDNPAFAPYKPLHNGKPANIAGFFLASQDATYMVMQAEMGMDVERLLYHEFLHYVMGTAYKRLPLWLSEGMAEFYSTFHATEQNAEFGRALGDHIETLRENNMIPLSRLFAVTYDSKDYNEEYRQGIFYAQSWALVHYLLLGNPARRPQTFQFFQSVAQGAPAAEAFRSAFQTTEEQIEKELRDYVRRSLFNYAQIPVKPAAELKVRVEPLPRHEALTRLGELLLYQRDAARYPEAEQHYRAALEAKPGYGPAQAGLCQIHLEAGRASEALACFEKAAKAAPDDADLQSRYARLLREQGPQDAPTVAKGREALTRAATQEAKKPDEGAAWQAWVSEMSQQADRLLADQKGEEALAILEEIVRRAPADLVLTRQVAEQLPGIRRVVEHNRFARRYNEAVALLDAQKVEEAHVILKDLVATTTIPEDAEIVRKLAGQVEEFLKRQPKK